MKRRRPAAAWMLALVGMLVLPPRAARAEDLTEETRRAVEQSFLLGRPDLLEDHLASATSPSDRFPLDLRNLWWRASRRPAVRDEAVAAAEQATGLTARRYAWLLEGGELPYPTPAMGEVDPWPVLTALVQERRQRESEGAAGLPEESPVALLDPPPAWADWYSDWRERMVLNVMTVAYEGLDTETMAPDEREQAEAAARRASDVRRRNRVVAILAGVLFVLGALALGWRLGPRSPPETA